MSPPFFSDVNEGITPLSEAVLSHLAACDRVRFERGLNSAPRPTVMTGVCSELVLALKQLIIKLFSLYIYSLCNKVGVKYTLKIYETLTFVPFISLAQQHTIESDGQKQKIVHFVRTSKFLPKNHVHT